MAVALTDSNDPSSAVPDSVLALAARFRARLADAPDNQELRERVEAWKAEKETHARAYADAERLWLLMGDTAVTDAVPSEARHRRSHWRMGGAIAACAGALLLAISPAERLLQDWRSDDLTAVGERREIRLTDGSRVTLNTDTALAYDVDDEGRFARLYRGEARFAVARDPAHPFRVRAGEATIVVLGTRFNVRMIDDHSLVIDVEEGRVRLEGSAGSAILTADEQGRLDGGAVSEQPGSGADAAAWRHGRAVFYDTPLSDVVANLNRYRRGSIILVGSELRTRRVTGTFRTDDAEALPEAIRKTLGARSVTLPGGLVLLY